MLKRASRKLRSTPAKTLMYIILFLVLFLAIFSMLMIGIASGNKVKRARKHWTTPHIKSQRCGKILLQQ